MIDPVIAIDSKEIEEELSLEDSNNIKIGATSNNLAYVIYTSGTTGKPKGVMQFHNNIIRLFKATDNWYKFNYRDVWVLLHSYIFDFTIWEIWGALIYGGRLLIISRDQIRDLNEFYYLCKQKYITVLNQTPSLFYQFIDIAINKGITSKLANLRYVIFGGEALNLLQLKSWFNYYGYDVPKLINMYGITETTVHVTYKIIQKHDLDKNSYIGNRIPDLKTYILDKNLNVVPIGGIGELYIGGEGIARGYLGRAGLTAERFIANPYAAEEDISKGRKSRIYKTGDLARYLSDGNIEYIGRNDFQVKIRGYRIELGEIENSLLEYEGIKQSVVIAREHKDKTVDNKYLVGYYVAEEEVDEEKVLNYIGSKLPEYMVPSVLVYMKELPLTINGKLDRKSLPDPELTNEDSYVAPRNEVEEKMCEIWGEVLGIEKSKIGIQDNFFRLGGDSIVSIQLVSRLRQKLDIQISIKDIFTHKSIERLYDNELMSKERNKIEIKAEQGRLGGEAELLPIQRWFFNNKYKNQNHWNQSFMIKVPELDKKNLQEGIDKLLEYHDSLRFRYRKDKANNYVQYYNKEDSKVELKILDIRELGKEGSGKLKEVLEEELTRWQRGFNLNKGPIVSIGYIYGYKDGSARVCFALHHLVVDAVSWRIITEDLREIYEGKELGKKGSSYRQWGDVIRRYGDNRQEEREYWENVLSDYDRKSEEINKLVESEDSKNFSSIELSKEETDKLLKGSNRAYNTEINDILLTALGYALKEITGEKVNHIVLEGHGREEIDKNIDITRTVGWFTSMYPVRLEIGEDIGSSIKNIKEGLRQIPNKGIGYGALIGYKKEEIPRISFNYLGQFDKGKEGVWNIVSESSGRGVDIGSQDYNIININGLLINNTLIFYFTTKIYIKILNKLSLSFKQNLIHFIKHCIYKRITTYTISDFNEFEPYVRFNNKVKSDNNNIFIFPPGGGGAASYFNNIVAGTDNKNLILFNNYYDFLKSKFNGDYLDNITYEILAKEYITYIKSIQSTGQYNLFGWSFGGLLAFEVARQLIENKDEVANIILIDPYFHMKKVIDILYQNIPAYQNHFKDINYRYTPEIKNEILNTKITLFKALQPIKKKNAMTEIIKFYVKNVPFNFLDKIMGNKNFSTTLVNCNHDSFLTDSKSINVICNLLKSITNNKL